MSYGPRASFVFCSVSSGGREGGYGSWFELDNLLDCKGESCAGDDKDVPLNTQSEKDTSNREKVSMSRSRLVILPRGRGRGSLCLSRGRPIRRRTADEVVLCSRAMLLLAGRGEGEGLLYDRSGSCPGCSRTTSKDGYGGLYLGVPTPTYLTSLPSSYLLVPTAGKN